LYFNWSASLDKLVALMATDQSGQRAAILKSCENLRALMASIPRAVTFYSIQELARIKVRAQTESESGLARVADDLAALIGRLKSKTPAMEVP
jgi:hypothetical protein